MNAVLIKKKIKLDLQTMFLISFYIHSLIQKI
nr:MAG TPA: hypothetical protein [Caudoviricetes sp.]